MWAKLGVWSLLFASVLSQTPQIPIVTIEQGTVVGTVADDGSYYEFHGIPYADSTSGSHRFKAPLPPPSFQDTFTANRKDIKCVRALGNGFEGTEDCLVVNVFTPTLENSRNLSVMVWIKGKEFDQVYEKELSFKHFVEKEVVVVSINFRESILGFLCLGTEIAPGNAGLKDIIAGLRWVQDNIAQFGGNPNDVTLFGHGSGAAAVDLVTLSPMAEGLVHKAIAQSGNALAPWAVTRDNLIYAVEVAEGLGHTVTDIETLSEIFTRTSVAALMAVINELDLTDNSLAFSPCIEREGLEDVEPFLIKSPFQTISDREFLQIPFIAGYVDNEGTIRAEEALEHEWLDRMEASFNEFIQPDLAFDNEEQETEVAQQIRSFYFQDRTVNLTNVDDYLTYHGDTMILISAIREVRMRALISSQPVYLYQFSYKGSLGIPFVGPLEVDSAAHSEELAYMFYENPEEEIPIVDLTVGDIMIERWTNFAKTGSPTSETSQILWRPFTSINAYFLRILNSDEVNNEGGGTLDISVQNPHPTTMTFWDGVYMNYFLDAEGRWTLFEREDDDDDNIIIESGEEDDNNINIVSGEDNEGDNSNEGNGIEDGGEGEEDTEENEDEDEDEGAPDSASTAVGYTFLITTLFGVLSKLHATSLMS